MSTGTSEKENLSDAASELNISPRNSLSRFMMFHNHAELYFVVVYPNCNCLSTSCWSFVDTV